MNERGNDIKTYSKEIKPRTDKRAKQQTNQNTEKVSYTCSEEQGPLSHKIVISMIPEG